MERAESTGRYGTWTIKAERVCVAISEWSMGMRGIGRRGSLTCSAVMDGQIGVE